MDHLTEMKRTMNRLNRDLERLEVGDRDARNEWKSIQMELARLRQDLKECPRQLVSAMQTEMRESFFPALQGRFESFLLLRLKCINFKEKYLFQNGQQNNGILS
jgi:regulator of replication initiation timing